MTGRELPEAVGTDDGDALRLAVLHCLSIQVWAGAPKYPSGVSIVTTPNDEEFIEHHDENPYAATRRAIFRAAAAIDEGR